MSGAQRIKRKHGRPKGTPNLPPSYWLAIVETVDEIGRKRGRGVSDACRNICDNGGLKWLDSYCQIRKHCRVLTRIDDPAMLRKQYYKALRFVRAHNIPKDRPRVPRQRLLVFNYTGGREGRLRKKPVRRDRFVFMPNPEK
jgi:hypothetical protein